MIETLLRIMLLTLQIMNIQIHRYRARRIRRWWVRPHLREALRQQFGAMSTIFLYFYLKDHEEFYDFVGMSVEHYEILLNLVRARLTRYSPRGSLAPELELAAVLNFLVHNAAPRKVAWFHRIGRSTMYKIIPEVCRAIKDSLMNQYVRLPATFEEWIAVANEFFERHQLTHCLGALDAKHVIFKQPPHSGALFFNFKGFYSMSLMAVCDANRRILWASVGAIGSLNDITVFRRSNLGIALRNNAIEIFNRLLVLPNTDARLSPFLIADGGFALESYVMKPFQINNNMTIEQSIFNKRVGPPRKVIEHTFEVLTRKFKIFERPLDFSLPTIDLIVMACVCLHNFLLSQDQENVRPRHRYGLDESSDDDESDDSSEADDESLASSESSDTSSNVTDASSHVSYESLASEREPQVSADEGGSEEGRVDEDDGTSENESMGSGNGIDYDDNDRATDEDDSSDDSNYEDDNNRDGNWKRDYLSQYFVSEAGNVDWQWDGY